MPWVTSPWSWCWPRKRAVTAGYGAITLCRAVDADGSPKHSAKSSLAHCRRVGRVSCQSKGEVEDACCTAAARMLLCRHARHGTLHMYTQGKNVSAGPTEARLLAGGLKDDLASCQENLQVLWRHWLTPWLAPAGESHLLKEVAQHSCDHRDFPDHQIRPGDDRNRINYTNLERIVCMQGKFLRGLARSHLSTATFFTPRCRPVCQPLMETVSCDSAPGRRHVELFRPARGK